MSSRTFTIGRQEAETILDAVIDAAKNGAEAYYLMQFTADIVHKFGISDRYILREWPEDSAEMMKSYLYPLPANHPSVRNAEVINED